VAAIVEKLIDDANIFRAAKPLTGGHGDAASRYATRRCQQFAERRDQEGYAVWRPHLGSDK